MLPGVEMLPSVDMLRARLSAISLCPMVTWDKEGERRCALFQELPGNQVGSWCAAVSRCLPLFGQRRQHLSDWDRATMFAVARTVGVVGFECAQRRETMQATPVGRLRLRLRVFAGLARIAKRLVCIPGRRMVALAGRTRR